MTRPGPIRHLPALVGGLVLTLTMTGCTALASGYAPPVTVRVTPTVTVTPKAAAATSAAQPTAARTNNPDAPTQVKGRNFDYGTIAQIEMMGITPVLSVDRWKLRGVSDSALARRGATLDTNAVTRSVNSGSALRQIPVDVAATTATFDCTSAVIGAPAPFNADTLNQWQAAGAKVLFTLNNDGWATALVGAAC